MFKKSALAGVRFDPPLHGTIVFDGYAEVRVTPKDAPSFLKQRIKSGKDIIAIWFQHAHAQRFKDLQEWDDIRVIPKNQMQQPSLLPKIEEMTSSEIWEFCKSIDVHPAHLVPFDRDMKLSLPTPLLELLVEIACPDISGEYHEEYDVYLAKAAIAFECKRIRNHLAIDKLMLPSPDRLHATFSQACANILNNPLRTNDMATAKMPASKSFGIHASRSYPYVDRVRDLAIMDADVDLQRVHHHVESEREIISQAIDAFLKAYKKYISPQVADDIEGAIFLDDVVAGLEEKNIPKDASTIEAIGTVVQDLLGSHTPYSLHYKSAQAIFTEKFGVNADRQDEDNEEFFQALEAVQLEELGGAVQHIFNSEARLTEAEENQMVRQSEYLLKIDGIHEAFKGMGDGNERNLVNNRVLLGVHNISIKKVVAPTSYPR